MSRPVTEPLRIYLMRHGQTAWSVTGQHTGRTDIALTENGEAEAALLAPALGAISWQHVFSSPLQRARKTCELAGLGRQMQVLEDLAEWDYGAYEGLRSVEIRGLEYFRGRMPRGRVRRANDGADRWRDCVSAHVDWQRGSICPRACGRCAGHALAGPAAGGDSAFSVGDGIDQCTGLGPQASGCADHGGLEPHARAWTDRLRACTAQNRLPDEVAGAGNQKARGLQAPGSSVAGGVGPNRRPDDLHPMPHLLTV
jgi:hypothetical protein